jgi:hypothetical protein
MAGMTVVVSKIEWGVSPDHCEPYRHLTGTRGPEPPPPEPDIYPPIDPHFFDVVLLVGSESGENLDESLYHHALTPGQVVAVSSNAKFGTHSIDPTVPSSYISYGAGDWSGEDEFNLSPTQMSEFTIEAWVYQTQRIDPNHPQIIVGRSFLSIQWAFGVEDNGALRFAYQTLESGFGGNGKFTNIVSNAGDVPLNQWTYVAVTKDAAKHFRLYVNGVMKAKRTPNDATIDGARTIDAILVGQIGFFGTNDWLGQIDELRITKRVARYRTDTSYPLPKRAWPRPPPTTTAAKSWEKQNAESI